MLQVRHVGVCPTHTTTKLKKKKKKKKKKAELATRLPIIANQHTLQCNQWRGLLPTPPIPELGDIDGQDTMPEAFLPQTLEDPYHNQCPRHQFMFSTVAI
jgi:hypothetical protein